MSNQEFTNLKNDIQNYIYYTHILEDEYQAKHEELQLLVDYTEQILNTQSISQGRFDKIKKELRRYPGSESSKILERELEDMIKQQKAWNESSKSKYNIIKSRIGNTKSKSRGKVGMKNSYKKSKKNMSKNLLLEAKIKLVRKKRTKKSKKNIKVSRRNLN